MPRKSNPVDADAGDATAIRKQVILDPPTIRTLEEVQAVCPDIRSVSAAIRMVTREWKQRIGR
jgi:hypothetical protein